MMNNSDKLGKWVKQNIFSKVLDDLPDDQDSFLFLNEVLIWLHKKQNNKDEIKSFKKKGHIREKDLYNLVNQEIGKTTIFHISVSRSFNCCTIHIALKEHCEELKERLAADRVKIWEGFDKEGNDIYSTDKKVEDIF